jgi:hypothetical protein
MILLLAIVCQFTFPIVILVAGLKMKRLEAHWLAIVGSLLAIVMSPGSFFFGLPLGMWSLIVLCQRSVRAGFQRVRQTPGGSDSLPISPEVQSDSAAGQIRQSRHDAIRQEVKWPANGLIATALLAWFGTLLVVLLFGSFATIEDEPDPSQTWTLLLVVALFAFPAVMLIAGLKMKRLEGYWLAVAGSVLAMITSPGSLIGFPIGIWSLVVLSQRDVRAAFRDRYRGSLHPERITARDPRLVPVFATLNLVLAVLLMLMVSGSDPLAFPEDASHLWRIWGVIDTGLAFAASAGLFAASIGLYLWKPWARKLIVAVCVFGLVSLVIDMPYLTRAVFPDIVKDLRQSMISDGISEQEAQDAAVILVVAMSSIMLITGLTWLITQLVYFTRPKVIAAFKGSATAARTAEPTRT